MFNTGSENVNVFNRVSNIKQNRTLSLYSPEGEFWPPVTEYGFVLLTPWDSGQ